MCRQVTCRRCGKVGWAGCGRHVDAVMAGVPQAARCPGHEQSPEQSRDRGSGRGSGEPRPGLLARFRRR